METDAEPAGPGAEVASAHTTDRMSARNQRIELITRGERRRRGLLSRSATLRRRAWNLAYRQSRWRGATASAVACSIRGGDIYWKDRLGSPVSRWRSSHVLQ